MEVSKSDYFKNKSIKNFNSIIKFYNTPVYKITQLLLKKIKQEIILGLIHSLKKSRVQITKYQLNSNVIKKKAYTIGTVNIITKNNNRTSAGAIK